MNACLLGIPLKETDEVNWIKPLNNYLYSIYGNTNDFQQELTKFHKLRQDVRGAKCDATGLKLCFNYYSQLELVDLRFSFDSISKTKGLNFVWYDAFHPSSSHSQTALPYEKACVLFNIAGILAGIAINNYEESCHDSSLEGDSVKEAIKCLQQAAGVLEFLNSNFLHAPSSDLSTTVIRFLSKFLLAQGQEVFLLRVISTDLEQKKNSLIAKLAASAAQHYSECYSMIASKNNDRFQDAAALDYDDENSDDDITNRSSNESEEAFGLENLDGIYEAVIYLKMKFYDSLAFYYQGLHIDSQNKYGISIAYLTKASKILSEISSNCLKQIAKSEKKHSYEILDNLKYQKEVVGIKLNEMNKDNDLIYNHIVPSESKIEPVKPMDGVKVIPIKNIPIFEQINQNNYENFFSNVIPVNIHELLSFYSEEKAQLLRTEIDMVEISNEETASVIEMLNMPKAVVELKSIVQENAKSTKSTQDALISPEILGISSELQHEFESNSLKAAELSKTRKSIYQVLNDCDALLQKSYSEQSEKYKDSVRNLKKSLLEAGSSDATMAALVGGNKGILFSALSAGPNSTQFKQLFNIPKSENQNSSTYETEISLLDLDLSDTHSHKNDNDSILDDIKIIEDINHQLNVIKSSKANLIEDLKQAIHKDDISDILILNSKVKTNNEIKSVIFEEELKKFEPFKEKLNEYTSKEKRILADLQTLWDKLTSNSKVNELKSSREYAERILKVQNEKIREFYQDWKRYSSGLTAGCEFYNKLLNYALRLREDINAVNSSATPFYGRDQAYAQPSNQLAQAVPPPYEFQNTGIPNSGYSRPPPALPPKESELSSRLGSISIGPGDPSTPNKISPSDTRSHKSGPTGGLIYTQPSTYQSNMYNYFSNS